jgi:P pilus assembly chaperone PapD
MFTYTRIQLSLKLTILAAAILATVGTASAQVGLGLTPMREELTLTPGTQQSGILTLTNDSTEKVRVVGELLDFHIDSTGTPQFGRQPQEAEFSCRQWLTLNPMELELNGKEHVPVRYTVRAPQSATDRSFHCAIGFTTQPTANQIAGTGLRTAVQIVAAIYVVVGRPALEGSVKDLKLEYLPDPVKPGWQAVVVLSNPGLIHFRPAGTLDVLDEAGKVVESAQFIPLPVLPRRDQNFLFPLKLAGGPGKYTLRARVDLGGNEIQEATALVVAAATPVL